MDKTVKPNIRKLFIPPPGYLVVEVDLKQADAAIVAWEAKDAILQDLFLASFADPKFDVHVENARVAYGILTGKITELQRQTSKRLVHGTNFGGHAKELAKRTGLLVHQVEVFQRRWFSAHPSIKIWHKSIEFELQTKRCVTNIYGYRRTYFDRIESILPEALAWKPQSTTALTINKGIRRAVSWIPSLSFRMQVHDSALFFIRQDLWTPERKIAFRKAMSIELPYSPRPLTIAVDLKTSLKSWGDVEKEKWTDMAQAA